MNRPDDLMLCHAMTDGGTPLDAVEAAAWGFVAAGGTVSLAEYGRLTEASRDAMRRAQTRLWAERFAGAGAALTRALGGLQEAAVAEASQARAESLADRMIRGLS